MGYTVNPQAAARVVEFARRFLTHQKGEWAGQPLELADWQVEEIIAPLFGTLREDGTRRYRQALCFLPRKNGKSTLAVLIGLYCLFCDGEEGAEVYCCAADTAQAEIVFGLAKAMVLASAALRKRARIYRRSIVVPATNSVFKVLSSEAATKHGANASCVIYDEVHAWKSRELYDVLHTSTGSRRQPLEFVISTAGIYEPEHVAFQLYQYAKGVREGRIADDAVLPCIYEAPQEADYRLEETWRTANPGLGTSIKLDYLRAEAKRAETEPSYQNVFRRLHLGHWTEQVTRWLPLERWDECQGELPELSGRPCYAGLDLSTTTDLSAFVLAFLVDGKVYLKPHFWIPEAKLRTSRDRVPYDAWKRAGLLTVTPGDAVDYDRIRSDLNELRQRYGILELRYDAWNATQLAMQLAEQDGFTMTQLRQGFVSLSPPSKELERLIVAKKLVHDGNPILRWMVGNVAIKTDPAGNIKPDKSRSTQRIDGVVAAIMAISGIMADNGGSVYSGRGLLTL